MSIQRELAYLSELLRESATQNIVLGELLASSMKSLEIPESFSDVKQANEFLFRLHQAMSQTVNLATNIIANSNWDDLGNQSINRIKSIIAEHINAEDDSEWHLNRASQEDIDMLLAGAQNG